MNRKTLMYRGIAAVVALSFGGLLLSSCCAIGMLAHAVAPSGHGDGCMGGSHDQHAEATATKAHIGEEVTCPVDGMKLRVAADTPWTEYRGKVYYFCGEADQRDFLKQPERFAAS